jgi:hypothetical protein
VDLHALTRLPECQALFDALNQRQAGSGRFHAIFLLIKKLLVYLSSQESAARRQFLQPTIYESYLYVDGVCSDSSHRRKQESRNRAVLGNASQLQAHTALANPQPFVVPTTWSPVAESSPAAAAIRVHHGKSATTTAAQTAGQVSGALTSTGEFSLVKVEPRTGLYMQRPGSRPRKSTDDVIADARARVARFVARERASGNNV